MIFWDVHHYKWQHNQRIIDAITERTLRFEGEKKLLD
jgi:hypothetical protein